MHFNFMLHTKVYSRSLATYVVVAITNDVRKPDACVFVVTTYISMPWLISYLMVWLANKVKTIATAVCLTVYILL